MEKRNFLSKFEEVYYKLAAYNDENDEVCISGDPDYDMDYGVDNIGNIVIDRESTHFPIDRLLSIKYRIGKEVPKNDLADALLHTPDVIYGTYMLLTFENDVRLYVVWDVYSPSPMYRRRSICIGYGIHIWDENPSREIIKAMGRGWKGWWEDSEFIIDRNKLIVYLGNGGIVTIPEGVTKICEKAFIHSDLTTVIMANSTEIIEKEAFQANFGLNHVDLKNVRVIGDEAFSWTDIHEIELPETLEYMGKGVFEFTGIDSHGKIINHSNVVIDRGLFTEYNGDVESEWEEKEEETPRQNKKDDSDKMVRSITKDAMRPFINYYLYKIQNQQQEFENVIVNDEQYAIVDRIGMWAFLLCANDLEDILVMKDNGEDEGLEPITDGTVLALAKSKLISKIREDAVFEG